MRNDRGGILFDFFLIVVIMVGGAALWFTRARWLPRLPKWPAALARGFKEIKIPGAPSQGFGTAGGPRGTETPGAPPQGFGTAGGPRGTETPADLSRRSAEVQAMVRELLTRQGIEDADVLKTYSVERSEKDARWVEATLEVSPGRPVHSGKFLKRLAPSLARRGLSILRDESRDGRWILEIGHDGRIFQRLVLHPAGR